MKYRLNETPIKTTNGFNINDINVDLDIKETDFNDYKCNYEITKKIKNNFNSKIGLELDKYYKVNIDIKENKKIILEYNFDEINNYLVDEIVVNVKENITSDLIIKYYSKAKCFHHLKLVINTKEYSNINVTIINNISSDSINLSSFESNISSNSNVICNYIDLCGVLRITNYYSIVNNNSRNEFNNIYYGSKDDRIDMNYYIALNKEKSKGYINVEGALDDSSIKSFKGTLDFISGSKKSIGEELENCVLLSDSVVSKSLPMLLCTEEDVIGSHGVSTGKIDKDKLFYLMSRGISEKEANKLIIKANYNKIINKINDEDTKEEINKLIEEII